MKNHLSALLLLFCALNTYGQKESSLHLGSQIGLNTSSVAANDMDEKNYSPKNGLQSGINFEYRFINNHFIETNLCYLENGYRQDYVIYIFTNSDSYLGKKTDIRHHYLQNNINFGHWFGNKICISPVIGFYNGWLFKNKAQVTETSYITVEDRDRVNSSYPTGFNETTHETVLNKKTYSNFDFGLNIGTYLKLNTKNDFEYILKISYQRGLKNLIKPQDNSNGKYFNSTLSMSLAINFKL